MEVDWPDAISCLLESDVARQEAVMTQAIPWIEALYERAGRAQLLLDYLVGYKLMQLRRQPGVAEPLFRREIQA